MSAEASPWKKLAATLGKMGFTALGTAVAGPGGGLIGSVIGEILGNKKGEDATEAALANASPETLAKIAEIESQVTIAKEETKRNEEDNVTSRHAADMMSDSWLSKNIRPLVLAFIVLTFVILIFAAAFWLPLERAVIVTPLVSSLGGVVLTVIGFYFGGRSVEKSTGIFKS
jgi:ABC-type multidrug transport system fused ATPase/permease subunit